MAEASVRRWPPEKELEMPDSPGLSADKGILKLKGISTLELWKTLFTSMRGPRGHALQGCHMAKKVRETPVHLKGCAACRSPCV